MNTARLRTFVMLGESAWRVAGTSLYYFCNFPSNYFLKDAPKDGFMTLNVNKEK